VERRLSVRVRNVAAIAILSLALGIGELRLA
jgi:hypothetical protein